MKKVKQYTLDELGELIVSHRLTDKEAKEVTSAIRKDKERNKLKKATTFKLNIPSVFSEVKKMKRIFSPDDLLEQIGPRPLTEKKKRESGDKLHTTARKLTKSTSEKILVSEPQTRYKKSK